MYKKIGGVASKSHASEPLIPSDSKQVRNVTTSPAGEEEQIILKIKHLDAYAPTRAQEIVEHQVFGNAVNYIEKDDPQLPPKLQTRTPNKVTASIKDISLTFVMDEGADGSIMPFQFVQSILPTRLDDWTGPQFKTPHHQFKILGEWRAELNFQGGHTAKVRWCVVEEKTFLPLLGMDFIKHYEISHDWKGSGYRGRDPQNNKDFFIPMAEPRDSTPSIALRAKEDVKVDIRSAGFINCVIPKEDEDRLLLIEPSAAMTGALRLPRSIQTVKAGEEEIHVVITNWDEQVIIQRGTLVGHASEAILADTNSVDSYVEHSEKQNKQGLEDIKVGDQLSKRESKEVKRFLQKHDYVFSPKPSAPQQYKGPKFKINTLKNEPIKQNPHRVSPMQQKEIDKQVEVMLNDKIIEPSQSPWASPVVLARKKDSTWRFCIDYRKLNSITKKDAYSLPRIEDTLDAIGYQHKVYSVMDISSGYWHIPMEEEDKEKTAFTCRTGLFQFRVMPFGLTNAPAMFHRAIDNCLRDVLFKIALVFVDDIVVFSEDIASHYSCLERVFKLLTEHGFTLKLSKCLFFSNTVSYLGFKLKSGHITVEPDKVKAIATFNYPLELKGLQRYLGMVSWYRRFIPKFATIAAPLFQLLGKDPPSWEIQVDGSKQNVAFESLRKELMQFPILRLPDFTLPFLVLPDASNVGVGGILAQVQNGFEHPIHYISKAHQLKNHHSYEQETYALVFCLKTFRHYLLGSPFTVITDCRALCYFNTGSKIISPKIDRWLNYIQSFDPKFCHREGKKMATSDALSRDSKFEPEQMRGVRNYDLVEDSSLTKAGLNEILNIGAIDFRAEQRQDRKLKNLIELMEKDGKAKEEFKLFNGILCFDDSGTLKPIVPEKMKKEVLKSLHDDILAGHQGVFRTQARVESRYFWEGMKADIADYVRNCPSCNVNKKLGRKKYQQLQPLKLISPWMTVQMDYIGPLKESRRKNVYILTMIDAFSKYIELSALPSANSKKLKKIFQGKNHLPMGNPPNCYDRWWLAF